LEQVLEGFRHTPGIFCQQPFHRSRWLPGNKFQEAAQNFEAMKARYSSRDEEATWNLLLCHYARYREADARKSLHKQLQKILKDPEHAYTKAALRLKKAVESQ
ncbi:MAG: hypothetical protein SGI94_19275, partial [Saprospiraceae bacterium]|nr:hypothetical protein [Saprospiraceae bacterium]